MHKVLKLNNESIFLLFTILICLSSLDNLIDGARYLKYIAGPLALLVWISRKFKLKNQIDTTIHCFILYTAWLATSMLWGDLKQGAKDIIFITSYVLPIFLFYTKKIKIESIFWTYLFFFALSIPGQNIGSFSISESTTFLEGASSFVFGAFLINFTIRKKLPLAALSLILMLVTLKRIALLGVILCLILWYLPPKIRATLTSAKALLAFNSLGLLLIIATTNGSLNELVHAATGKGISEFTLGRTLHYIGVVTDIAQNPQSLIFGNGAGSAYEKAIFDHSTTTAPNLHSDTLKIFYEGGAICFFLFFYFIGKTKSIASRIIILYISTLFITDNVLIYAGEMFFILITALRLEQTDLTEAPKHTKLRTSDVSVNLIRI